MYLKQWFSCHPPLLDIGVVLDSTFVFLLYMYSFKSKILKVVSMKLPTQSLGTFVWHKKLDRDLCSDPGHHLHLVRVVPLPHLMQHYVGFHNHCRRLDHDLSSQVLSLSCSSGTAASRDCNTTQWTIKHDSCDKWSKIRLDGGDNKS
jgi:hypothetical protein